MDTQTRNQLVESHRYVARQAAEVAARRFLGVEADEAEGVALLAMLEQAPKFDPARGAFARWAFGVAINAIRDSCGVHVERGGKKRGRTEVLNPGFRSRSTMDVVGKVVADHDATPEEALLAEEARRAGERRLERMPPAVRARVEKVLAGESTGNLGRAETLRCVGALAGAGLALKVERAPGAARSRRWYASLTPEQLLRRKEQRRAREAARRAEKGVA